MSEVHFVVIDLDKELVIPSVFHVLNGFGKLNGILGHLHPTLDVYLDPDQLIFESLPVQKDDKLLLQSVNQLNSSEKVLFSAQFVVITDFFKGFELIVQQNSQEILVLMHGHDQDVGADQLQLLGH